MAGKGVVQTTNVLYAKTFSFMSLTDDLENGSLVAKGKLIDGEREIYEALKPDAGALEGELYLVANPAWSYDDSKATSQNEDEYVIPKGTAFRVYLLTKGNKYAITDYSLTGAVVKDNLVTGAAGSYKGVAAIPSSVTVEDYGFVGEIELIDDYGYFYPIGQFGVSGGTLGTGIDTRGKMIVINVVKNG